MDYSELIVIYERIGSTTKRLEITAYLVELFKKTSPEILDKVVYLTQGQLYPDFVGIELGLADKLVISALAFTTGMNEKSLMGMLAKEGDMGEVAAFAVSKKKQQTLFREKLSVEKVYGNFELIAKATGGGAQDKKIKYLSELLHYSSQSEAKYIVRTVLGKLRLGVADMTIIDALAESFATKAARDVEELQSSSDKRDRRARDEIERAYNIHPDLGHIAKTLATIGFEGVKGIRPEIGIPLRSMLCERVDSMAEIFEKMTPAVFEYKYDGLRIQAHITDGRVSLFSRRLENITTQFPDLCEELKKAFTRRSAILDAECVPIDINTGELLPFQEVSHRRGRKYDVTVAIEDYPVHLFLFDCMFLDDIDLTLKPYMERRNALVSCIKPTEKIKFSEFKMVSDLASGESFFNGALNAGCEGIIAKATTPESTYRAGARGWLWIKYKLEYKSEMVDTADLVIIGAFAGRGRRKGSYGALLMAAYNPEEDAFETVCKLGSGFDDSMLAALPEKFKPDIRPVPDKRVNTKMKPDFWLVPKYVMEVIGAEITLSPVHTCGFGTIKKDAGLAIRFPRFSSWREDKRPEDASTSAEIAEMYRKQLKKLDK
jgi:DNA ligase-1